MHSEHSFIHKNFKSRRKEHKLQFIVFCERREAPTFSSSSKRHPRTTMNNLSTRASSHYTSRGLDLHLSGAGEQEGNAADGHLPRIRRTLIDYTVTNRLPAGSDSQNCRRSASAGTGTATDGCGSNYRRKSSAPSHLPSFASLEKIPYGSMRSKSDDSDERIDFFLKIEPRRSSESRVSEMRAGFEKPRSTKSRLFGSFTENGEIRKSYADFKELLLQKERMEDDGS